MSEEFDNDQHKFIKDLISLYKENPVLWDKTHKFYKNRTKRTEAYDRLLVKCREYFPEADEDFVRTKLENMRTSFRKEYRKVLASRLKNDGASEVSEENIYKPSLWYYNLLLYTVGEKCEENEENFISYGKQCVWNRAHSAKLLMLLENHPCLYSVTNPKYGSKSARMEAYKRITEDLINATGKKFEISHVQRKIQLLKDQYRSETKKLRLRNTKSTLWCYNLMSFLSKAIQNRSPKTTFQNNLKTEVIENSYNSDDNEIHINEEHVGDIYDTIGNNVAHKLRQMEGDQGTIASKLINEVLYYGQMGDLTNTSLFILSETG